MSVSFKSEIKGPLQNVNAELLTAAIDQRCQKYFAQRSAQIAAAQLKVIVHAAAVDERRLSAVLKLGLEGQVNDAPVRIHARAQRTTGNHGEKAMHRLLNATERMLTDSPAEAKLTDTIGGERLDQCVAECVAKLEMQLDKLLGVEESTLAKRWRLMHFAGLGIATVATLVWYAVTLSLGERNFGLVMISLVATWASIFLSMHCLAILLMPKQFFVDEPRGRKAMSRLGTQSIPQARVISAILIVVLLTSGVGLGALVVAAKPKPVNPNIIQPGGAIRS